MSGAGLRTSKRQKVVPSRFNDYVEYEERDESSSSEDLMVDDSGFKSPHFDTAAAVYQLFSEVKIADVVQ